MNLSDLKDRIFRMTNHIYNDTFHMRDLINTALNILSGEAKLEGVTTYSVTPENLTHALPSGYKSTRAMVEGSIDNPTGIYNSIALDEIGVGYTIFNGNVIFKGIGGTTLNHYYYRYATELVNDSDEVDNEFNGYGDVIASYAAAMILSLPGMDANRYLIEQYLSNWEQGRARFQADRSKRNRLSSVRLTGGLR